MASPATRPTMRVELRVLNQRIAVEAVQPEGDVRLDEALPFLRAVDDAVVGAVVAKTEADGAIISCRKGCAHCCRGQPVWVTPQEALALSWLVESLPEPRRQEVLSRFTEAVQRLRESGLAENFLDRDPSLTRDQARSIAQEYFHLYLGCPFLVDEACSIYPDRPFVCRQYLVTSPVDLCRDPFTNPVKTVPMPIRGATAALETAMHFIGQPLYTVPLVLALEYAEAHREELERRYPAEQVFRVSVNALGLASSSE